MAKTSARDRKSPAPRNDKGRKAADQMKDTDLDKVVGGLRSTGGPRPGDPCDGGE